jgi:hypothetical protein
MDKQHQPQQPEDDELVLEEEVLDDLEMKPDDADAVKGGVKPAGSSLPLHC